jgi:putative phosphoribosyl transferase
MGAIASGGVQVLNPGVVTTLGISEQTIDRIAAAEGRELERRARAYRGDRPPAVLAGRHVILIDDGLATGATMRAAATAARAQGPAGLVVAVPVAPEAALELLEPDIDELVCPATPEPFIAVSHWYEAFPQVGDEEVRALLEDAPDAEPTSQFASPHDGHGAAERHAGA